MRLIPLDDKVSVSPQISIDDLPAIAAEGFRTVVCNRPDFESPDQPLTSDVEAAAEAAGLRFVHLPVVGGMFSEPVLDAFGREVLDADEPVLAYCLSGTRSACLWALTNSGSRDVDEILATAANAGFHIEGLRPMLEQRADQKR